MDQLRIEINSYLFMEFGIDGDEDQVSATWPFDLKPLVETENLAVFEFQAAKSYFAVVNESLVSLPQAGMGVQDLLLQLSGADWIRARNPVDLSTVRLGDSDVPPIAERRSHVESLGHGALDGGQGELLEGLLLPSEQIYLGLFTKVGTQEAVAVGLPDSAPISVPFPEASPGRRLAWAVGSWLTRDHQTG